MSRQAEAPGLRGPLAVGTVASRPQSPGALRSTEAPRSCRLRAEAVRPAHAGGAGCPPLPNPSVRVGPVAAAWAECSLRFTRSTGELCRRVTAAIGTEQQLHRGTRDTTRNTDKICAIKHLHAYPPSAPDQVAAGARQATARSPSAAAIRASRSGLDQVAHSRRFAKASSAAEVECLTVWPAGVRQPPGAAGVPVGFLR